MRHIRLPAPANAGEPSIGTDLPSGSPTPVEPMGDALKGEAGQ
jgi:hypothetical protein